MSRARIPRSTYRLQFNSGFRFADARAIVDYLHAFGISDCYASSYFAAVPGSLHGYDVTNPTKLNPDIGTKDEYWAWIEALLERRMGHILDLVPNHMGIAKSANPWWQDVLENGPSSRFAHVFDIEWHPIKDELANKVLIPILGDQYGAVLERQELHLIYGRGSFAVRYHDNMLPVAPDTYSMIVDPELGAGLAEGGGGDPVDDELQSILTASGNLPPRTTRDPAEIAMRAREKEVVKRRLDALASRSARVRALIDTSVRRLNGVTGVARSFDGLDRLLNEQSYRLAHWRVASEEINYRRFFDVNELAALRMEDPTVFDEVHRFAFELIERGAVTGLRIDHVDGLYAPGDYLRRLQTSCRSASPFFIVVEKILGRDEQLRSDWPVHGTTGYEFAAVVNNLFIDSRNQRALDNIYLRFVRERRGRLSHADLVYHARKQVMHLTMSGDINSLGHQLNRFSERHRHFRDFTLYNLISTLKEVIACFPVYRTYITADDPISDHDRHYIVEAIRSAKRRAPAVPSVVFDFIERLFLRQTGDSTPEDREARARFVGKFQQITSPVAAKGIEDTALYVYNRLLSLNEVGADPTEFGMDPSAVHEWLRDRQQRWPHALSATSTHDTKRGEEVRARLNVLSEIPGAWKAEVTKWRTLNRRFKPEVRGVPAPSPNEEYLLYQTLVGVWPFATGQEDERLLGERLGAYAIKAMREAKVNTSWLSPDVTYEDAVLKFIEAILDRRRQNAFLQEFLPFQSRVAELGVYNSLAQLLIKITAPGIPDFYQGTELWDLNLVDPDNRRPVDYQTRRRLLESLTCGRERDDAQLAPDLLEHRADGRVKMFAAHRALACRARERTLYEQGEYVPLQSTGARHDSVFAFARRLGAALAITAVPRLIASLVSDTATPPLGASIWSDTRLALPANSPSTFRNAFTDAMIEAEPAGDALTISAATLFDRFPIALIVATD